MIWQDGDWALSAECLRAACPSPRGWGEATHYYIINCRLLHENSAEPHWALLLQRSAVMIDAWSLDQLSYMPRLDGCHYCIPFRSWVLWGELVDKNWDPNSNQVNIVCRTLSGIYIYPGPTRLSFVFGSEDKMVLHFRTPPGQKWDKNSKVCHNVVDRVQQGQAVWMTMKFPTCA